MASLRLRGAVLGLSWSWLAVPLAQMRVKMLAPTSALVAVTPPSLQPPGQSRSLCRDVPFGPWLLWQAMPKPVPPVPHPVPLRFGRVPLGAVPQDQASSASDAPEVATRAMEPVAEDIWSQPSPCLWTHCPWICPWHRAVRRLCAVSELSMSPSACSTARGGERAKGIMLCPRCQGQDNPQVLGSAGYFAAARRALLHSGTVHAYACSVKAKRHSAPLRHAPDVAL